jgi:colanic acid/amylovoran biosynthesis glycosyltransferase
MITAAISDMDRMRIAHFINPFLNVTENWIYSQLAWNTHCDHIVLCRSRLNERQFPFDNVRCRYPSPGWRANLDSLVARLRAQYPRAWYRRALEREKPRIFHAHFVYEAWRNFGLVRETGLPLVTSFYGLDITKLPRRREWRPRYERLFSHGRLFICEGPHAARQVERLGCPSEKIRVVRIGVDVERIRSVRAAADQARVNVLFVGLEKEKKGAEYAAAAFAMVYRTHPDMQLHLIGDGRYRSRVERILQDAGAHENAVFHGQVPVDEYLRLLGTMHLCLAPSITAADGDTEGGAPVTVIEAQVAGIPVIGTTHCDIPAIVAHGETGLLCPERDVDALARDLSTLANDRDSRLRMGEAASRRAAENHDIRRQVLALAELYRSLLPELP